MKAISSIAGITLAAAIISCAMTAHSAGPVKNNESRRDNPGVASANAKSEARKGGEWFADPERGWVRIDGRRDVPEGAHPSSSSKTKRKKTK